jgi:hypothetical protein
MTRLATWAPDPARFWVRYAPREWAGPAGAIWSDLASAQIAFGEGGEVTVQEKALDDVLYLPPVAAEEAPRRDAFAAKRLEEGTPVLVQLRPGDAVPPAGAAVVYDLTEMLLGDRWEEALATLPPGAAVVWPLIAGISDEAAQWEQGAERLARAGVAVAQALALQLAPQDRRRLAERTSEEAFFALFHRQPPGERSFAVVAARYGLAPFLERPLPRLPLAGAGNRRLAGQLLLASELWLAVGRSVGRGLGLARAARWVDEASYDVAGLAREGNLGLIPEIDELSRNLLEAAASGGSPPFLNDLLAEYTGDLLGPN